MSDSDYERLVISYSTLSPELQLLLVGTGVAAVLSLALSAIAVWRTHRAPFVQTPKGAGACGSVQREDADGAGAANGGPSSTIPAPALAPAPAPSQLPAPPPLPPPPPPSLPLQPPLPRLPPQTAIPMPPPRAMANTTASLEFQQQQQCASALLMRLSQCAAASPAAQQQRAAFSTPLPSASISASPAVPHSTPMPVPIPAPPPVTPSQFPMPPVTNRLGGTAAVASAAGIQPTASPSEAAANLMAGLRQAAAVASLRRGSSQPGPNEML